MCASALALSLELISPEGEETPRRHPEDRRERYRHPLNLNFRYRCTFTFSSFMLSHFSRHLLFAGHRMVYELLLFL
jgi:hypothetical protein